jgi:hypothetical protein
VFDDRVGVANPKSLLTVAGGFLSNVLALLLPSLHVNCMTDSS